MLDASRTPPARAVRVEIGPWRLDPERGLFRGEERVRLAPKELATLGVLAGAAGRIVGRAELVERVWPDVAVTAASLARCVYVLRRTLAGAGGVSIETVPRRGYRLVGPVRRVDGRPPSAGTIRLAVLPFQPRGLVGLERPHLDALAAELIARLSGLHGYGLSVTAPDTALPLHEEGRTLAEIGRELGLDYVLGGIARLDGAALRVRAELVRVADLAQVWTESFERPRDAAGSAIAKLAESIASRLPLRVPVAVRTRIARGASADPRVGEALLQARWHWSQRAGLHLRAALALYERVLDLDPGCAAAHAGVAACWLMLAVWGEAWPLEAAGRARAALDTALAIDPDLAAAHAARALLHGRIEWDLPAAQAAIARALAREPGDADVRNLHAQVLLAAGRAEESLRESEAALALDPASLPGLHLQAFTLLGQGRLVEAEARLQAMSSHAGELPQHRILLALVLARDGRHAGAGREIAALQVHAGAGATFDAAAAEVLARAGQRDEAHEALGRYRAALPVRPLFPSSAAAAVLALGEPGEALAWLERAAERHCPWLAFALSDRALAPLRDEPRFRSIVSRVRG